MKLDEPIDTEVYIELTGEPTGVREGGILQQQLRSVEVRCLPADLPDKLEEDITHLAIGDTLTVGQLSISDRVELLTDSKDSGYGFPPRMEQDDEETDETEKAPTEPQEKE